MSNEIIVETISSENINEGGVLLNGAFNNVNNNVDFSFVLSTKEGGTYDRLGEVKTIKNVLEGKYSVEYRTGLKNGQKYYFNVFIFLDGEYFYGKEKLFVSNGSAIPVVNNLSSNKANLLDTLLIKGSFFSQKPKVYFSEVESVPLQVSDSLIKVVVPYPKNNYLSTLPYSNIKIINEDKQEKVIDDFSLYTPRIDSILPRKITDSDTLKIYGDYFEANMSNMVLTTSKNQEFNYTILKSTKNEIVLKPMNVYEKKPEIIIRSQLTSVKIRMEVLMPIITSLPTKCLSFGESLVVKGANFPINNNSDIIKLGGNYIWASIKTRDSLVFKLNGSLRYKDFEDNEISINYLEEEYKALGKICIDEPLIKLNYDHSFSNTLKMHVNGEDIFALGSEYYNSDIINNIFKFNRSNNVFEKITNESFHKTYTSDTGSLNSFHGEKLYSKKYSSKFVSYDIFTNKIVELADFPGEKREYGFMIASGDYIYIGLGLKYFRTPMKDIWRYSIVDNSWEKIIDDFPGINSYETSKLWPFVFAVKDKIYIGAGQTGMNGLDFWELDTQNNQLTKKIDLPKIFKSINIRYQQIVTVGDEIYFHFKSMIKYDSTNDVWSSYETNNEEYNFAGYFYFEDEIYMKYKESLYKFNSNYLK